MLLVLGVPALASETELAGGEGHPRSRFPLSLWAAPLDDPALDAAVRRAVDDWNAVFRETLGPEAFAWAGRREQAQVTVVRDAAPSSGLMGVTHLRVGAGGVIAPPVRILVAEPAARGQTGRETVLYQVLAHELGHALGLGHVREPDSLMCCEPGSVNFDDPAARQAYVQARRHPDVGSVRGQLAAHFARFWRGRD